MKNIEIRHRAGANGIRLWQIAQELGVTDSTLSRKLRVELSDAERERVLKIIEKLAGGAGNE